MTLRGLSRELNMPYSTTRKYLFILRDNGLVKVKDGPVGLMIEEDAADVMRKFVELLKEGLTIDGAVKRLMESKSEDWCKEVFSSIERLEKEIVEIRRSIEELKEKISHKKEGFLIRFFRKIFKKS